MNADKDFTQLEWVKNFAEHFRLPVRDVKLVYQVFLGNRVQDWPHPFGDLEPWVASFESAETKAIRDGIVREKGWHGGGGGMELPRCKCFTK